MRMNIGRRIHSVQQHRWYLKVNNISFLFSSLFYFSSIFNHGYIHTYLFSELIPAELLRERYMTVLGKSSHQRSRGCCAPKRSNKKNPGTHIIYGTKMKRCHIPEVHTDGGRMDYDVVKDLGILLDLEMTFTAHVDSMHCAADVWRPLLYLESDIS